MIDLSKSLSFGKQRGRPQGKKKQASAKDPEPAPTAVDISEGAEKAATFQKAAESGDGPFIFKSKFREDVVTLVTPIKTKHADGSTFVDPGKFAEFHRNTWTTQDPVSAQQLRQKIEERKDHDPLHIVETTS